MAESSERLVAALGQWRAGRGPLFERLASALVRAGEQAALPPGGELPAERVLARELDISRSTVVAAYQQLREHGMAVTRHGSGTVMRNVMPAGAGASSPAVAALLARADHSAPLIDLSVGAPDFDDLVRDLTVAGSELPQRGRGHGYVPLGWPELRDQVAQLLSRRGAPTSPDEVLITNGAQEAISLAVGLVAADGRRIAVESPGYSSALDAIARAGGQPLAIERDAAGLRVDSLKQVLERHHIQGLYIAPSCNNPTGSRTAPHRRERIAALAADHELTVIEDTVLDELCFDADPGAPIWSLLPERVLTAGSLSKVAWGGLRVGWLRAPRPVILRLARIKAALNIGVGAFDQLAALTILDDYPNLCRQRRAQAGAQMDTIVNALRRELPDWNIPVAQGGWSLWLSPPAGSGAALAQAALRHGVAITPGAANSPDGAFPEYIRICYGAPEPLLEAAAQRLAAAWNDLMTTAPIDSPINA
jgi:DNA-binding transcriptional MocR family regulator